MDCEVCGTAFHSKRDLRNHLAKTDHRRMRYICVWCFGKHPREFKSDWDLRRHIRAHHPHEHDHTLKEFPRLLSSENTFFFSTNPQVHLLTNPVPNPSAPEAIEARRLVTKWATGRVPGINQWLRGWNSLSSSSTTSSTTPSAHFNPHLALKSVKMDNTGCTTICATESTYVKATISQSMLTDARVVSRLVRRMNALPKNVFIPSGHWEPGNSTYQASVATLLGLQPDEIQSVAVLYVPTFTTGIASRNSPVPATTASTQANSPEHPTSAFVPTTDISDRVTLSFTHPSSISTSSILSDVTSSSKTDVKTSKSPSDAAAESSHSTLDSTPKRLVIEEHPDSQPDLDYEIRSPTPVSVGSPAALPSCFNSPFYNPVSPLPGNMVTSAPTPNYEPEVSQQQPQSALEASAFSTPCTKPQPIAVPVYIPTPRHLSQKEVLKTRAHSLLLEGRLPLLPPARREWSDIPSHSIQITPNISWPPADWTSWSPDQRTLSHEFVAMTLHSENKPLPRSYLRAKFNFLALPGSLDLQNDALAATLKTNFNLVRLIALGEDPTTPEVQMAVLSAFEALPRDSSLDVLLSRVKDVPLRLKKQKKN